MFCTDGVSDDVEEVFEPGQAADVFGWAAALAGDEPRIVGLGITCFDGLDGDIVASVIAHVVGVCHRFDPMLDLTGKLGVLCSREVIDRPLGSGRP